MIDRRHGALIGLAVGDALGAAVEFKPPSSCVPVTGYRNGGPHRLEAGEWTDDTSMALADSIARAGWDLNDQARHGYCALITAHLTDESPALGGVTFHARVAWRVWQDAFIPSGVALPGLFAY